MGKKEKIKKAVNKFINSLLNKKNVLPREIKDCSLLLIYTVLKNIIEWDLGKGETSVLQYALNNKNVIAVIDDAAARKCAKVLGIPYCGTLGALAKSRKLGLVDDFAACVDALKESGLWISQTLINKLPKGL